MWWLWQGVNHSSLHLTVGSLFCLDSKWTKSDPASLALQVCWEAWLRSSAYQLQPGTTLVKSSDFLLTPRKASAMQEIAMNPSRHSKSTSLSSRRLRFNSFLNMRMNLQIFFPYLFVYLDYVVHKVDTETHLFSLNEFSNRSGVMLFLSSYTNL